jgi:HSP20 family protein
MDSERQEKAKTHTAGVSPEQSKKSKNMQEVIIMFLTPYRRGNDWMSNPFRAMDEMERSFFGNVSTNSFRTDIRDEGNAFVLEADLPGFDKKDIHVDVEDGYLTIQAERHSDYEKKDKKGDYVCCERSYGSFSRSFDTTGIDTGVLKAAFKDGVLTLTLPKLTEAKPASRRLEIE